MIEKKQLNVSVSRKVYFDFQKKFPQCLSRFVRNALRMALSDKRFFQLVFFNSSED